MERSRGPDVRPSGGIFTGESMSVLSDEIDYRRQRFETEAANERLAEPRKSLHQHVVHAEHALARIGHLLRPRLPHLANHGHHV
jgi:hypothetical protein